MTGLNLVRSELRRQSNLRRCSQSVVRSVKRSDRFETPLGYHALSENHLKAGLRPQVSVYEGLSLFATRDEQLAKALHRRLA